MDVVYESESGEVVDGCSSFEALDLRADDGKKCFLESMRLPLYRELKCRSLQLFCSITARLAAADENRGGLLIPSLVNPNSVASRTISNHGECGRATR